MGSMPSWYRNISRNCSQPQWTEWHVLFQGALCGGMLGFIFPMWISIGAYVTKPDVLENLNTSTAGCYVINNSDVTEAMYANDYGAIGGMSFVADAMSDSDSR